MSDTPKKVPDLFNYNLPVQVGRDDETGEITEAMIYMPRKGSCYEGSGDEIFDEEGYTVEEMCEWTAKHLENLALLWREFAAKKRDRVYYPDEDFSTYTERLAALKGDTQTTPTAKQGKNAMNVSLTPELERFVQAKVASGMYGSNSEVVRAGLRLLVERDGGLSSTQPNTSDPEPLKLVATYDKAPEL